MVYVFDEKEGSFGFGGLFWNLLAFAM